MDEKDSKDQDITDDLDWLMNTFIKDGQTTFEDNMGVEIFNLTIDDDVKSDDDFELDDEKILLEHNTNMNDAEEGDDYDLQQRIERANKELEKEDLVKGVRERKVGFKVDLVSQVQPQSECFQSLNSTSSKKLCRDKSRNDGNLEDEVERKDDEKIKHEEKIKMEKRDEEIVINYKTLIVEKGGKFECFVANEQLPITVNQPSDVAKKENTESLPSVNCRQISAPVQRNQVVSARKSKVSVKTFTYSEETKKMIKEQVAMKKQLEVENANRKKKEELMAREEANEIWKSWIEKKDEERKQKRRDKMDENRRKEELERKGRDEPENAFKAWLKQKSIQARWDRIVQQQQQLEQNEGYYTRERVICDRSFRTWLRGKNNVARKRREIERLSRKSSEREIRTARKADKLINSLRQTNTFKHYSI